MGAWRQTRTKTSWTSSSTVSGRPDGRSAAAHHFRIEKAHGPDGTRTTVRRLTTEERREEIARMLSGAAVTDEARAQAARLLEAA